MNRFFYFVLGGVLLVGILGIFALPIESSLPPTPAFKMINSTSGNVTAHSYSSFAELVAGSGITLSFDYSLNEITISAPPGGLSSIHQIGNVSSSGCAENQILKVNSTGQFACAGDNTGISSVALDDLTDVIITGASQFQILYNNGVAWVNQNFKLNSVTCSAGQFISTLSNSSDSICTTPSGSGNMTVLSDAGDTTINNPTYPSMLFYNSSQWVNKIFSINNQSVTEGFVMVGQNNLTGVITTATIKNPLLDGSNHTDTTAQSVSRGSIIYGDSTPSWNELTVGASGTVLKSDGTDVSWGSVSGAATSLSSNVTASNTAAYSNLWKIQLTANSGNVVNGIIVGRTSTAGVSVQAGANLTSSTAANGWCLWETPTGATSAPVIDFVVLSTTTTDTGETAWLPAVNEPAPIRFTCTITTGSSAPLLWINIQPEAAGTVTASAGSYYIKTP